jgi:hypothetical protein
VRHGPTPHLLSLDGPLAKGAPHCPHRGEVHRTRCNAFLPGKGELHVHHRKPVAKSMALALEPLNLMPVCPQCRNVIEPRTGSPRIKSGCDELGHPLSPDHPWNKVGGAGRKNPE